MKNPLRFTMLGPVLAVAAFVTLVAFRVATYDGDPAKSALAGYRGILARLDSEVVQLDSVMRLHDVGKSQAAFRSARKTFKRSEMFVEYYADFAARELNAPPIPHPEDEDPENPLPPTGFQVIEAAIFAGSAAAIDTARAQIGIIRTALHRASEAGFDTMPGDSYLFDAARQELARVATLGIAGFDATVSGDAIVESADAIDGIGEALSPYIAQLAKRDRGLADTLCRRLASAAMAARVAPDFEQFDRLRFIANEIRPLSASLSAAQQALEIPQIQAPRAWSAKAANVFEANAFDPMFFAATDAPPQTPELIALGRDLFFDPAVSAGKGRSCASCHVPALAFTDGQTRPSLLAGHDRARARNTPTLVNAGLQPRVFMDQRVRTLEDQATDVIGSAAEMGSALKTAADSLARVSKYAERFRAVVPSRSATAAVRLAIAAYVRSLTSLDSRFDRAVRGDLNQLSREERLGFNLFMGKGGCGTCHFAPLFTGAMPPRYLEDEPETIGVPADRNGRSRIDPDSGRALIRRIDLHAFAFKTPTLRNIELTVPYMHNGVFRTLDEVVDFYDGGGGAGRGIKTYQTLPTDSLHLTPNEKRAIVAFMRSLTDTAGAQRR